MARGTAAERLAEAIKARRVELGLTQHQLAERVGVDHNSVSRWELGTRAPFHRLDEIASALEITPDALLGRQQ